MCERVLLDMAREKGIQNKLGSVDFQMYHDFLKALYKSYLYVSKFDRNGNLKSAFKGLINDLKALLNFIANSDNTFKTEYLEAKLSQETNDDEFLAVINTIPEYLLNNLSSVGDREYKIFQGTILVLNKAIKNFCSTLKQLYAEQVIKLNSLDEDGAFTGKVLLRSMQSLKKSYLDKSCSKYTVSTRVVDTGDGTTNWYAKRDVALLYDFNWQSLVCMSISDLSTDNVHKIDYEEAIELGILQEKLFIDYQLPLEIGVSLNWCDVYPVLPVEILDRDNEVLFTADVEPIGIVISENYYKNHLGSDDYAGVKVYSAYAEIPIYYAIDGKYVKLPEVN